LYLKAYTFRLNVCTETPGFFLEMNPPMADRFSHDLMRTDNGPAISRLGTLTDSVQAIRPPRHSNLQPFDSNVLCTVSRREGDNKEDETF
jgi:hypothetical protein